MLSQTNKVVYVATESQLRNPAYYRRLWIACRNTPIVRRSWLDELADTFRDYDGCIRYHNGQPFEIPLVDDVFGDDPDMRWFGHYLEPDPASCGRAPARMSYKIERLQIIDIYFRIRHPQLAVHFER